MNNDAAALDAGQLVLVHVRASAEDLARHSLVQPGFAGVVEAVGTRVTAFRTGDAVYGVRGVAFAGYLCLRQDEIAHMPAALHFDDAATAALAGLTALQALRDRGCLQRGERLLVAGGSRAGSRLAVQLGVHHGAHVTAACPSAEAAEYRALGADIVDSEAASGSTYDVVLHWGRRDERDRYLRLLAHGDRIVGAGDRPVLPSGADLAVLAALFAVGVLTLPASAPSGCR